MARMSFLHRLALCALLRRLDTDHETEWIAAHVCGWHRITPAAEHTEDGYRQLARDLLAGLMAHATRPGTPP